MRKLISLLVVITSTLLFVPCTNVSAATATSSTEIMPINDSYYVETTTVTHENVFSIMTRSTSSSKSISRVCKIKNAADNTLATYTLNATYTYNGTSSSCTSASCSTSITDSAWKFTAASASRSGNKANGSYTATCRSINQTVSDSVSVSCSANGTIK